MTITGLAKTTHMPGSTSPPLAARLACCGVARSGVSVRVVDDDGRTLPPVEVGEVVTRSDCVMRGYWNNPAATE
jgi:long-chain acyl-CoA synthetase